MPESPAPPPLLRLAGIGKAFGALRANDDITLKLRRGEVLALLGENGAGKSTLVSILFGHYVADAGTIEVDGQPLPPGDTRAALTAGIGMVHQHFTLADNLSVLDNVMLGTESLWRPWSRRAAARQRLAQTARRFGLEVDADARVGSLAVGERQRVEILKALFRGARILILDEPTAVLTPQQSASLFATLRQLVADGLAVIFISHKLDEVLALAQRVAVLRAGRLVADLPCAGASKAQLASLMVGHAVAAPRRAAPADFGAPVCVLEAVSAKPLSDVNLQLRAGEIVGIAGVSGNGQQTLVDLLCGLRAADAGRITVNGAVLPARPRAWVEAGVARVPEDRQAVGVVGDLALWENTLLERYATPAYSTRWGWLKRERAWADARALLERCDVRGGTLATPARRLSGGNMQKLILGRALANNSAGEQPPRLIVAHQPTWGLDIGALADVHRRLLAAAEAGAAVLLVSEDLDELFALADRLAVMHQGRLTRARATGEWTLAQVGLAMSGQAIAEPVMQAEGAT